MTYLYSNSELSCCVLPVAPGVSVCNVPEHSCSGCPYPDGCLSLHQLYEGPVKTSNSQEYEHTQRTHIH